MNDAASVALLKAVSNLSDSADLSFTTLLFLLTFFIYVFVASFALGLTSGLAISWMMKHLGPFSQPQEVSLVGALAFLCYLVAELMGLSGILALFFCGMAVSHYALQHVSRPSQAALLNAFRTLSYLLEGFIFLYVGRDALDPVKWANASFLQTLMLLVIICALVAMSRAAFVFPCASPQSHTLCASSHPVINLHIALVPWPCKRTAACCLHKCAYMNSNPRHDTVCAHGTVHATYRHRCVASKSTHACI